MNIKTTAAVLRTSRKHRKIRKSPLHRRILGTGIAAVLAGAALWMPATSEAATITWGSATSIAGDTDVSTTGTLVSALNLGTGTGATVNGVTFNGLTMTGTGATSGIFGFSTASSFSSFTGAGSSSSPFSLLSSSYQSLLSSIIYVDFLNTYTLTISRLTIGGNYALQLWVNNASGGQFLTTVAAGNSLTLVDNVTKAEGSPGQFTIGTFTANGTSQAIGFSGSVVNVQLNALQLRNTTPATHWLGGGTTDGK
jgi:hypothetical protein